MSSLISLPFCFVAYKPYFFASFAFTFKTQMLKISLNRKKFHFH
jgi:hypothetical protein